jgi:hypothetical protein
VSSWSSRDHAQRGVYAASSTASACTSTQNTRPPSLAIRTVYHGILYRPRGTQPHFLFIGAHSDVCAALRTRRKQAINLGLIRRLRDHDIAVVLVSHRMPDVFAVADRIVVLRRGVKVADKTIAQSSPEEVTGLITGAIEAA